MSALSRVDGTYPNDAEVVSFEAYTGGVTGLVQLEPMDRTSNVCRLVDGGIIFSDLTQLLEIRARS